MLKNETAVLTLPGDAHLPLYYRLAEYIRKAVAQQKWLPGSRLPSESEIASQVGVAVGTVRQAFAGLVKEGLLVRRQGKGTYVKKPTFDSSLFRFWRFCDEGGERRLPESRILTCRQAAPPARVREVLGLPSSKSKGAIFLSRLRLWEGKPIVAEEIWLPYREFAPLLNLRLSDIGTFLYPTYERICGKYIARAEERLTAELATEKQARMIDIESGTPIIVIGRLARGYDDIPLEWRTFWGCASRFQYKVEVN